MKRLINKHIVLGVTGSVAAYKGAELVRRLRDAGAEVQVVMTAAATGFVTPLTFQALSGRSVRSELLDTEAEAAMSHIELARWADAVVVAPASADFLARLARGRADDLLTTLCLATEAALAVAPAMNRSMWEDAATQENCRLLGQRGIVLFGPTAGAQACGETGPGRLLQPEVLAEMTAELFATGALAGLRMLITAGPTQEAVDPIRYISNRSSGRMGYALAAAAVDAGARVTLVSGPVLLTTPERVSYVPVHSAQNMYEAVMERVSDCDIFVAAAAVADYRPVQAAATKIKRARDRLVLELEPTPDILCSVSQHRPAPFTVGFAAETENVVDNAGRKLRAKSVDMIVANRVGYDAEGRSIGFESTENACTVLWRDGRQALARASKHQLARRIVALIAERYHETDPTQDPR